MQTMHTANNMTDSQYIGQTNQRVRNRLLGHCRDIIQKPTDKSAVAEHFNCTGHTLNDIQIFPLLQLRDKRKSIPRAKEQYITDLANILAPNRMNRATYH